MKYFVYLIYISVGILTQINGYSQITLDWKEVKVSDGLPSNMVLDTQSDDRGIIWFATTKGLARYDGTHIKVEESNDSTIIYDIFKLENGNFWLATEHGLQVYNPFQEVYLDAVTGINKLVLRIRKIDDLTYAAITGQGIYVIELGADYYPRDLKYYDIPKERFLNTDNRTSSIRDLIVAGPDVYISISDNGVWRFPRSSLGQWTQLTRISTDHIGKVANCLAFRKLSNDRLIFNYMEHGVYEYDITNHQLNSVFNPDVQGYHQNYCYVTASRVSDDGKYLYLFSSHHGLYRMDTQTCTVTKLLLSSIPNFSYIDNTPFSIYIHKNTIWLNTVGDGVKYATLPTEEDIQFIDFTEHIDEHTTVTSLYALNASDYLLTTFGQGLIHAYKASSNAPYVYRQIYDKQNGEIPGRWLNTMRVTNDQMLWVGGKSGLYKIDLDAIGRTDDSTSYSFDTYRKDSMDIHSLNGSYVNDIYENADHQLYIITTSGLNFWDSINDHFIHAANSFNQLFHTKGHFYYADQLGPYDLFNQFGASYLYDGTNITDIQNWSDHKFNMTDVVSINATKHWLATDRGLLKLDIEKERLEGFPGEEFFSHHKINNLNQDRSGRLWMGTNQGLYSFDTRTNIITSHELFTGQNNIIYNYGVSTNKHDIITFSTNKGLVRISSAGEDTYSTFSESELMVWQISEGRENPLVPLGNRTALEYQANTLNSSDLVHFRLSYPSYGFENHYTYQYTLSDHHNSWLNVSPTDATILLHKLSSGSYPLKVRVLDRNKRTVAHATIYLDVLPPWWQSRAAIICYILAACIIVAYVLWRNKKTFREKHLQLVKRMESDKQHQINKLKLEIATTISHEFNVPLTLLINEIKKLKNALSEEELTSTCLRLETNVSTIKRLSSELIDINRIDKEDYLLPMSKYDIVSFVKSKLFLFQSLADQQNISLEFKSSKDPIMTWFNSNQMDRVISNLLSNAIKFSPKHTKIAIAIDKVPQGKNGQAVTISVSDSGKGIGTDEMQRIFDKGYSTSDSDIFSFESMGVGLYSTKKIVEMHGGTIEASQGATNGVTFTVTIPSGSSHLSPAQLLDTSLAKDIDKVPATASSRNGKAEVKNKILVVDDAIEIINLVYECLKNNYTILHAKNGIQGYELAKTERPKLIITDLAMPVSNGFHLIKSLRKDNVLQTIPIIVLTAFNDSEKRIKALNEGVIGFLSKPFDGEELRATVNSVLLNRDILKETLPRHSLDKESKQFGVYDLLKRSIGILESNIDNPDFDVMSLAQELNVSRSYLYKRFSEITNYSPRLFIHIMRVRKAAKLLKYSNMNINEISFEVGYFTTKSFRKYFTEYHGITPLQYLKIYRSTTKAAK